jgi:hypothetical protein
MFGNNIDQSPQDRLALPRYEVVVPRAQSMVPAPSLPLPKRLATWEQIESLFSYSLPNAAGVAFFEKQVRWSLGKGPVFNHVNESRRHVYVCLLLLPFR